MWSHVRYTTSMSSLKVCFVITIMNAGEHYFFQYHHTMPEVWNNSGEGRAVMGLLYIYMCVLGGGRGHVVSTGMISGVFLLHLLGVEQGDYVHVMWLCFMVM